MKFRNNVAMAVTAGLLAPRRKARRAAMRSPEERGRARRLRDAEQFDEVGVGPAIVRRTVERHGGQVRAEGRPDVGATFCFSISYGENRG